MTAGDLRIALVALFALSATVAVNLLAMQDKRAGSRIETSSLKSQSFEATVTAAINSDLGPPLAPGAAPLRVSPPKAASAEPANIAEIIRGVQRELNQRGYEAGQPDGVAGLVTRAAIMAYEYDYGLALTATPSQDLLSRIVLGSSAPSSQRSAEQMPSAEAGSVTRSVEQQLAGLGYTPGKADGLFDEQTARAIREFEVDQKLPESGRISGPLVSRLTRLQGQGTPATAAKGVPAPPAAVKPVAASAAKPKSATR